MQGPVAKPRLMQIAQMEWAVAAVRTMTVLICVRITVRQARHCGASRDPQVPEVDGAADPQAALPAPGA